MHRVTVIVAAYNAADTIEATLASVFAQSYADWQVVVGDDCSSDDTARLAAAFGARVRVVTSARNAGTPAATRAMAIAHADSELIAFLDGDDLWEPGYLQTMVAALDARRGADARIAAVACDALVLLPDGTLAERTYMEVAGGWPDGDVGVEELLRRNPIYTSVLLRRAVYDEVGGLDGGLLGTDDHDLWLRIAEHGYRIHQVRRPLARYRLRDSSLSADRSAMAAAAGAVFRRALERGRLDPRQRRMARRALRIQDAMGRCEALAAEYRRTGRPPALMAVRSLPVLTLAALENAPRLGAAIRGLAHGRRPYALAEPRPK